VGAGEARALASLPERLSVEGVAVRCMAVLLSLFSLYLEGQAMKGLRGGQRDERTPSAYSWWS
jgi:hypothetical protein